MSLKLPARTPGILFAATLAPIPDPKIERSRQRVKLVGEPPSPLDPSAGLRFLPSRLSSDKAAPVYVPRLMEVAPGHLVSEFDPI